ncbi:hypothetical protein [Sneathiella limimaris]|uniref:hypothetical protein n=1 Tax=Sneathiella limimaris TaxID=1964213 RepID=UPI00146BAFE3|nr:hypothetical protein [Sneathiella limimaris]
MRMFAENSFRSFMLLLVLGAFLFAIQTGIAGAATSIEVRAGEHPEYGRLVLDWKKLQSYEAEIENGYLVVRFPEAFEANLTSALRILDEYVESGEIINENKSLRLKLKGSFQLKDAVYGTAIALDLVKPKGQSEKVRVRAGDHPKYSRLVVDWSQIVDYDVRENGNQFVLQFAKPAELDLSNVTRDIPDHIQSVEVSQTDAATVLLVTTKGPTALKSFRSGNSIAFDFQPKTLAETQKTEKEEPTQALTEKSDNSVRKITKPVEIRPVEVEPAKKETEKPKELVQVTEPVVAEKEPVLQREVEPVADTTSPRSLIPQSDQMASTNANVALPEERLVLDVGNLKDGFRLIFPWEQSAAMALFERAGQYWIVFDKAVRLDFKNLGGPYKFLVIRKNQFAHPTATVARLSVREGYTPSVTRIDNEWRVDFRLAEAPVIKNTIDIQPQPAAQGGARVFIPAVNNGDRVELLDPQAGDAIIAVPLHSPSWGVGRSRTFTQFTVLPSVQGIAMTPRDPKVQIAVERNGVSVTAPDGLQLARAISQEDLYADGDLTDRFGKQKDKAQLVKLAAWRQVPMREFQEQKQLLQRRVARSPSAGRNGARMELARFFVGHKYYADALAVLERVRLDDPRADDDGMFRLLRGLSNLGMNHLQEAEQDLMDPVFNGVLEVAPWRAMLAAKQGDWKQASSEIRIGRDAFPVYDQGLQNEFNILAAETALEDYDIEGAIKALEDIKTAVGEGVDKKIAASREYLEGVAALRSGDPGRAVGKFQQAMALDYRPVTAKANFARVNAMLAQEEISPEEAIEEFKKMTFAWRGDQLELDILKRIGDLQIASGEMREGLKTFKSIVMTFPKDPLSRDIAREMNDLFIQLFLEGGADKLPPVKALALYYEFRELTPLGDKGDAMIRNLADRLIKVDLLEQAAQLLDHQVNFRLSGAQKSVTGAKLAVVHLWNENPKESLDILNKTRWRALPDKVKDERRHIQARASLDLERYDAALELLEGDTSQTADLLRSDIYWRSKNWSKAIDAIEVLLENSGANKAASLTDGDRQRVMQLAVARSLAGDRQGIANMRDRYRKHMVNTPDLDAFDLITDTSDGADTSFRERSTAIAKIGQLESFMAGYREQLEKGEFWSTN